MKIDTAAAGVKLQILRAELRNTSTEGDSASGAFGRLGRAVRDFASGSWSGQFSTFSKAVKGLSGGNWSGVSQLFSTLPGAVLGIASGGAVAAVVLGAIAVALSSIASVVAPAAIGLAAVGLFAIPTFSKISAGITAVTTAQTALHAATTEAARDTAQKQLTAAWKALTPAQAAATRSMIGLRGEFDKMARALAPDIFRIFNAGVKTARVLLPDLFRIAKASMPEIAKFLERLSKDAASPAFQRWLSMIARDAPGALKTLGGAIFGVTRFFIDLARWIGRVHTDQINWGVDAVQGARMVADKLGTFFTKTIPSALSILVNEVQLHWDQIVIFTLEMVQKILDGMSHIPFIGHYFRTAADAVGTELSAMKADAANAAAHINASLASIHSHPVVLSISGQVGLGVHKKPGPSGGYAAGTPGAAPGWALVGEQGPELVRMRGGEQVLPHPQTRRALRGYAAGAGLGFSETWTPPVRTIDASIARMGAALEKTVEAAALKQLQKALAQGGGIPGYAGPGGGSASANAQLAKRLVPKWAAEPYWGAWNYVAMAESGWNQFAQNASGAYGIPQALPYTKMPMAAWPPSAGGSANPTAQITWMAGYMASRWGGPLGAAANEAAFHWYGNGLDKVFRKPTLIGVGERGAEHVRVTPGTGDGGHRTYNITVNVPVSANKRAVGLEIIAAIREAEQAAGASWRR